MNKKCKVFMFPTSETVTRILYSKNTNTLDYNPFLKTNSSDKYQHIYILSDEKIKKDDWYLSRDGKDIKISQCQGKELPFLSKKIIATTNTSLGWSNIENDDTGLLIGNSFKGNGMIVKPLLPQPSQEFIQQYIEEYNKNNVISDVEVEYDKATYDKWLENGASPVFDTLKVNPDNTINIRPIKDSWSREEVIEVINKFSYENCDNTYQNNDKWIEENL